ncbi:hypothetical protein MKEN_00807000 [Mycena kentingensis (nom. inval.)]|nr:hypothetical protein MKEN_00807000 [Mycena kentingensis (nom. inval.)]
MERVPPNPPRWQPNPDPAAIVVPGLDTDAPILAQIEQIDQLITLKLQNIDENFAKIHNVLANRILPSVRRYAVETKPVREAANFWVSFYETAAQVRIPTAEDYSTTDTPSDATTSENGAESSGTQVSEQTVRQEDHSVASTETSFMPQAAFASTPAVERVGRSTTDTFISDHSEMPSWSASLESPVTRLARDVENYEREESVVGSKLPSLQLESLTEENEDDDEQTIKRRIDKGKGKAEEPMLKSVLRHNIYAKNTDVSFASLSPSKGKIKTPISSKYNPYIPAGTQPANWSGMVDLRTTPLDTKKRADTYADDDDDSFDGLPPGMSPPRLMSPARPPRSTAELQLLHGRTQPKDAAAHIRDDIVHEVQQRQRYESSMSTMSSPPSLSRYNRDLTNESEMNTSLESVIRRVSPKHGWTPGGEASTPGLRLKPKPPTFSRPIPPPQLPSAPALPQQPLVFAPITPMQYVSGDNSFDSDSDSLDAGTESDPGAFLAQAQAAQAEAGSTRSFDSDESSFDADQDMMNNMLGMGLNPMGMNMPLNGVGPDAGVMMHPLVQGGFFDSQDDSFDDSFDNEIRGDGEEQTVFGRPPAQRMAGDAGRISAAGDLLMYGDEASALPDTAQYGMVQSSPTPASR